MSSPDDNERSDDFPNSDYAPKWTRDRYRQGSPDTAKDEPPPSFLRRSLDPEIVHLPQSLDPETVDFPQPSPRRLGWLTAGGFIIAAALGAVIGLLATGELRSIFGNAPGSSTKTIELTSRSDNSKMPEQLSSPSNRLAIAPTAPQATRPSSPTGSVPIAPPRRDCWRGKRARPNRPRNNRQRNSIWDFRTIHWSRQGTRPEHEAGY